MTLPHIERADGVPHARPGKMDVEECTVQGSMAEKVLDGYKVRALFVEMSGVGMTEGVCRDRKSASCTLEVIPDVDASGVFHDV